MNLQNKIKISVIKIPTIISIVYLLFNCSCIKEPEQKELDPEFDVKIVVYKADTGDKLSGADVVLKTNPYRHGISNSSGKVTFYGVQQHGLKLHLEIIKSESNPEKYYHFESSQDGYPGGIDFYSLSNHTLEINVKNII